jgi:hypothetical protein
MHMKRALGTLTTYETFARATEIRLGSAVEEDDLIDGGSDESIPVSADEAEAGATSSNPDE